MNNQNDIASQSDLATLLKSPSHYGAILNSKKAALGFDGFIDTIARIIRQKHTHKSHNFFNKIKDFGKYIIEKEGSSFSLESEEQLSKLGGNMPIMANALANLGVSVSGIGAMGYPRIHPVFAELSSKSILYSFADPGLSTAYEFKDGKILIADFYQLNAHGWESIKDRIGVDNLIRIYQECDLIGIVNWSEIDSSTDIWKGLLQDVFPRYINPGNKQLCFFDLSDCSKRSKESIEEALDLLKDFSKYTNAVLGLNRNEAQIIYKLMFKKSPAKNFAIVGEKIFEKLNIDTVLLHSTKEAHVVDASGTYHAESFFVKNPKLSTGAGDNFNSGYCAGRLMNLDPQSALCFAHAVSGFYVKEGRSPILEDVISMLSIEQEKK
jgi:ketohexokinase